MVGSNACAVTPFGRTLATTFPRFVLASRHLLPRTQGQQIPLLRQERTDMTVAIDAPRHRLRPLLAAACLTASLGAATILASTFPALARGPDGIADVAEKVIDAVVNISTSQTVEAKGGPFGDSRGARSKLPPGSPFEEFFDAYFKNHRGGPGGGGGDLQPHKTTSLGSGFIVDTSGIVVTNNHVIADADDTTTILNDAPESRAC